MGEFSDDELAAFDLDAAIASAKKSSSGFRAPPDERNVIAAAARGQRADTAPAGSSKPAAGGSTGMITLAAPANGASKRSAGSKLSSSKQRRRKRRESRGQGSDGGGQQSNGAISKPLLRTLAATNVTNIGVNGSIQSTEQPLEGGNKRPRIDGRVVEIRNEDGKQRPGSTKQAAAPKAMQKPVPTFASNVTTDRDGRSRAPRQEKPTPKVGNSFRRPSMTTKTAACEKSIADKSNEQSTIAGEFSDEDEWASFDLEAAIASAKRASLTGCEKVPRSTGDAHSAKINANSMSGHGRSEPRDDAGANVKNDGKSLECQFDACMTKAVEGGDVDGMRVNSGSALDESGDTSTNVDRLGKQCLVGEAETRECIGGAKSQIAVEDQKASEGLKEQVHGEGPARLAMKSSTTMFSVGASETKIPSQRAASASIPSSEKAGDDTIADASETCSGEVMEAASTASVIKATSLPSESTLDVSGLCTKDSSGATKRRAITKKADEEKENSLGQSNILPDDVVSSTSKKKQVTLTQGDYVEAIPSVEKAESNRSCVEGGGDKPSRKQTTRQQITLTQGDFVETAVKEEKTAAYIKQDDEFPGRMESVNIRKTLKESTTFSKGDIWQSADPKLEGFAFTLGYIYTANMKHEAEISQSYIRLEKTYIEAEQASMVKDICGCAWLLLDEHALIPEDRRVQLSSLCNKLNADEMPKTALWYREEHPTYSYFTKYENQFTPPQKTDKPIAFDLFAGGGGMSIGLKRAGWNAKYKLEKDHACCDTLRKNSKKATVFSMDITKFLRDLKDGKLKNKINLEEIVLIHGSPPCQGFSGANTSGGKNDWQNKECTKDFLSVVEFIQPPFVSMENVPGMMQKRKINGAKDDNKSYLQRAMAKLISLGYDVSITMTYSSHFGDPQNRKRMVLLAAKRGYNLPSHPVHTHGDGDGLLPIVTVRDVLRDLEDVEPNCSGRVRVAAGKREVHGHFIEGTAITTSNDDDVRLYAENPLQSNAPSKTVRKQNNICHYRFNRYLTLLEYKRLMSFPDSHVLCGSRKEMRDQVGNAVPCHFATAIGKTIMESYRLGKCSSD